MHSLCSPPTSSPCATLPPINTEAPGRPVPPPDAAHTQDPELILLLSNPAIMNGFESDMHTRRQMEEQPTLTDIPAPNSHALTTPRYLLPPVLTLLNTQSVQTAQQATTLIAVLTWFFNNLPIAAFPLPLQPAMLLLQCLILFVSYISTFVSWSWGTICGFDRGHGMILTATWLLPIVLTPGTWHPSSSSSSLPPLSSPSSSSPPLLAFILLPPSHLPAPPLHLCPPLHSPTSSNPTAHSHSPALPWPYPPAPIFILPSFLPTQPP
ncbi:hypothetical protein B0H17DRAFT_1209175 [Mycena rosella]|uniref:Uncharacterized protein n=1 Tax=Mycena rosella TaxID=1033263 RepID=A0AAD7D0E2_MYCRO|nr:hypothetical protein B0H17DRAFT_1209175 [Mycena rosella]